MHTYPQPSSNQVDLNSNLIIGFLQIIDLLVLLTDFVLKSLHLWGEEELKEYSAKKGKTTRQQRERESEREAGRQTDRDGERDRRDTERERGTESEREGQ